MTEVTQDSGVVFRQTVRRVRVDVVVTDAKGGPVAGLQPTDFRVDEDGKPQAIRQFEYHADEVAEVAFPKRPALPLNTFMNLPEAPEHGPLTVVLFDALNTPIGSQSSARAQMLEFVRKSAGRRIAVFFLGDRLSLLQGFTSDADLLVQAVNQTVDTSLRGYRAEMTGSPTSQPVSPGPPPGVPEPGGRVTDMQAWERRTKEVGENARESYASELLEHRVDRTLDALVQISRFLSGFSGRKNLIWYSGSFPAGMLPNPSASPMKLPSGSLVRDNSVRNYSEKMKRATDQLNTAEVSIYPIDARGLLGLDVPFQELSAEIGTMNMIGEQTGGQAFYNTNGLEEALETASAQGSFYYSMVYAPTNMKYDGSVRNISVHLVRGSYHLAYRRSYIGEDVSSPSHKPDAAHRDSNSQNNEPASADPMAVDSQFGGPPSRDLIFAAHLEAVGVPMPATEEQLKVLAPYRDRVSQLEHKKHLAPAKDTSMQSYAIAWNVLARQMQIPRMEDGAYHSSLSIAAWAYDVEGATLWATQSRLDDTIPASQIGNIRSEGFQAIQRIIVPTDTAILRLVVRDEHSGRIGSMEIRLPLSPAQ